MLFNADLLNIIAESHLGFTVPDSIINSALYRYFTHPKCTRYSKEGLSSIEFLSIGIYDDVFLEYACLSIDTARWLRTAYYNEVIEFPTNILSWTRMMLRTALYLSDAADELEEGDDCEINPTAINNGDMADIFFAFATIEQLKSVHSMSPNSIPVDAKTIINLVGRLEVMLFLKDHYPAKFAKLRKSPMRSIIDASYTNKYGERSLETFEWLIANKYVKPDEDSIMDTCSLIETVDCGDDSIIQWLLTHHIDGVMERYYENETEHEGNYGNFAAGLLSSIIERCNTTTLKLYLEKVDNRLPRVIVGKNMVNNLKFMHAYILDNDIAHQ